MSIASRDFLPEITKPGFFSDTFESFQDSLCRANQWIAAESPTIINVETVVLPNVHSEDGSEDINIRTSGEMSSSWHQFVRVWYKT